LIDISASITTITWQAQRLEGEKYDHDLYEARNAFNDSEALKDCTFYTLAVWITEQRDIGMAIWPKL